MSLLHRLRELAELNEHVLRLHEDYLKILKENIRLNSDLDEAREEIRRLANQLKYQERLNDSQTDFILEIGRFVEPRGADAKKA